MSSISRCPERGAVGPVPKPVVIAHRGASGYLPEHTLEAKVLAYGQGADYLEQDVVATRDGQLIVLHDLYLDDVTDVAERFAGRCRADGHYYVVDFDLVEIRRLAVCERRRPGSREALFEGRFPSSLELRFRVATLDEEIRLIQGLNRSTGRHVGIYPELKDPAWHARHGIDLAAKLLEQMDAFGYRERGDPVFVQCFDAGELERLRHDFRSPLRTVQLLDDSRAAGLTAGGLDAIAAYADALGVAYPLLLMPAGPGRPLGAAPLAERVHRAGLQLHPYTFRADRLGDVGVGFGTLLEFFFTELRVDGLFCDHPDLAVAARAAAQATAAGAPARR